ncbi:putative tyrosyl-DNA phosphodiesterase [Scheffersomyces xylosifermentans]|uniref:putative tyrosyl-DNA phosphodiesterase n=1 Tax=Scheffersomyces xylosifermentans TaxID=1304137 RepID=UPI00315D3461
MSAPRKRSEAFLRASQHWANSKKLRPNPEQTEKASIKENEPDVEILSSDEENAPIKESEGKIRRCSPIRLLHNPSYEDEEEQKVNRDTIMLSNLIGTKDLHETFQFNFSVDLPMFLNYFHPEFSRQKKKITFITGSTLLDPQLPETELIKKNFNISELTADIPKRFGTHHTKMMVNFFDDDTLEIVIMTFNLRKIDFVGLTQALWRSGRLPRQKPDSKKMVMGARFKRDLKNYIKKYNKQALIDLAERIELFDFSSVKVELMASAPGKYDLSNLDDETEIYGYGKLYQILKRNNSLVDNSKAEKLYNFLAQVTSISYPIKVEKYNTASIFTHLLAPLVFCPNKDEFKILSPGSTSTKKHQQDNYYFPQLVYPTVKEVAGSNVGFGAGQAVHLKYASTIAHKNQYKQNIEPYLRKWNSSKEPLETGRESVVPHCKYFACDNGDNWSTIKWILMGSHNLSKQAWGAPAPKDLSSSVYEVSSYELGVVVIPEKGLRMVPSYGTDFIEEENTLPIRLPFKLPSSKYSEGDRPWSSWMSYGDLEDRFGETYNLGNE